MILKGAFNYAKVFIDDLDKSSKKQIIEMLNQEAFKDAQIRIMPDAHAGAGCVIGFTADLGERVIPNLVGVDIGCGMLAIKLGKLEIDFEKLDNFIRREIPYGHNVNQEIKQEIDKKFYKKLKETTKRVGGEFQRHLQSIGSLGSGNHFIEIDVDTKGIQWLVIHSGSRKFGQMVAIYHQKQAVLYCGRKSSYSDIPKALRFLEGEGREQYLTDMKVAQEFANLNREVMGQRLIAHLGLKYSELEKFQTVHNYINFKDMIVRKGAISAYEGEKVLIPLNMRDGSILAIGKGNAEWNYSAPHGAGRLFSRHQAKAKFDIEVFKKEMKDVWTTSVKLSTLDEAPMAYKPVEKLMKYIEQTVEVVDIIKPIYNFKS